MSKPALYTVSAFDATKDYTFRFRYIGVITKVEAQIWANAMSAEELGSPTYQSGEVSTQRSEFTLKASSITNSSAAFGIKVRVCGQDSAWSEWSDILLFYCVETPVFKFKEISTKDKTNIEYSAFEFTVQYESTQGEELNEYTIELYDASKSLVKSSETLRVPDKAYIISNLRNDTTYYARAQGITQHGMKLDTGFCELLIGYVGGDGYAAVALENHYEEGCIWVKSYVVTIEGKDRNDNKDDYHYVSGSAGDQAVDLTVDDTDPVKADMTFKDGFKVQGSHDKGRQQLVLTGKRAVQQVERMMLLQLLNMRSDRWNKLLIGLWNKRSNGISMPTMDEDPYALKLFLCRRDIADDYSSNAYNYQTNEKKTCYYLELTCGGYCLQSNVKTSAPNGWFKVYLKNQGGLFELHWE